MQLAHIITQNVKVGTIDPFYVSGISMGGPRWAHALSKMSGATLISEIEIL